MNWVFIDALGWDYDVQTPLVRPLGGSQSALCYLTAALARRGHNVTLVTGTKNPRVAQGVQCLHRQEVPAELFAAEGALIVALNDSGLTAHQLRRELPFPVRLILWTQHAHDQPAVGPLHQPAVQQLWDRVVCISDWQRQMYVERVGVRADKIDVLRNAISPAFTRLFASAADLAAAKSPPPRLVYTSTPFRGLDVLVNCFPEIRRRHPACRLSVYSSMAVYQTAAADDEYAPLYARCLATDGLDYRGSISQQQLAADLRGAGIFAYPCTFAETSCIAAMEALAAGLSVVTTDLGALRETCLGYGRLIPPLSAAEGRAALEHDFIQAVDAALAEIESDPAGVAERQFAQVQAVAARCNWDRRAAEWEEAGARWLNAQRQPSTGPPPPARAEETAQQGAALLRAGRPQEAEAMLREAIAIAPGVASLWNNLSIALHLQRRGPEAEACARRATQLDPNTAANWVNLGNALYGQRRWDAAADAYRAGLARDPSDAAAWSNLGAAEQRRNQLAAAQAAYEQSLQRDPGHVGAIVNLAYLLAQRGLPHEALAKLRAAHELVKDLPAAWAATGSAHERLGNLEAARAAFRQALAIAPQHREARYSLAFVQVLQWELAEAEAIARQLVAEDPAYADGWALLGGVLQAKGEMPAAVSALRRSVEREPDADRHSRLLLALQYLPEASPQELLAEHRQWDQLYAGPTPPRPAARHDSRLRIGFVSSDFGQHPTGFLTLRAVECLDRSEAMIACYCDRLGEDAWTARFRAASDVWRVTTGMTNAELAEQIRRDEIDVLIDLMGHVGKRLPAFALRPAPLQVTWFGYVGTTGLAAMDGLLADRFHVRPGEEGGFVERVLRMPNGYACYGPPEDAPQVAPLTAMASGRVTFGCFNNPAKISPPILDAWAEILRRTPRSQLLLKFGGLDQPVAQQRLAAHFAARGVAPERLLLEGHSPHRDLLAAYGRVDLALDTQPYSGGLTTCEALWMGVPVVTFPGRTFAGRHALSYMTSAGLPQFCAADVNAYIDLAVAWAGRLDELAVIRGSLREQMRASPVCDGPRFARDWLALIRQARGC